jgi:hypothetical protein
MEFWAAGDVRRAGIDPLPLEKYARLVIKLV